MQKKIDQKENPLNSQEARPNFWQSLDRSQKIALIVLAVFVLFLIIVWSVQFKRSLTEPFAYKGDVKQGDSAITASSSAADLKNKDTDGDGLSDWDELNVYKTSPYLEDSDSDGIKDLAEIKAGTDPNCPAGKNCEIPVEATESANNKATTSLPNGLAELLSEQLKTASLESGQNSEDQLNKLLSGELDASALRKMLLGAGMDQAVLNQLSDDQLVDNYRSALEKK